MEGISGVDVMDELEALYLKATQRKMQNPDWRNDETVWPWATAMWPEQPRVGRLWVPGVQLGYALADPPAGKKMLGGKETYAERYSRRVLDSMAGSGRELSHRGTPEIEGEIVDDR